MKGTFDVADDLFSLYSSAKLTACQTRTRNGRYFSRTRLDVIGSLSWIELVEGRWKVLFHYRFI